MSISREKLDALRVRLVEDQHSHGAILVVYPPEEELDFRDGYLDLIRELRAHSVDLLEIDLRTLPFEVLASKGLIEKALKLDAQGARDARQNLAGMVQRGCSHRIREAAASAPGAVLCCLHTASLYPWMSFSALLEEIENLVPNTLVIPFPGSEDGPALHFLGAADGYNYRASRV
jgi:hypothetical protein